MDEDNETFTVAIATSVAGWNKAGDGADSATVTIIDDDTSRVTVSPTALSVAEGGSKTYAVVLDSKPTAGVTVEAASQDAGAVTVTPASRAFTPDDWDTVQRFTVSGVLDAGYADESVTIGHSVTSADRKYSGITTQSVTVRVDDNDTRPPPPPPPTIAPPANLKVVPGAHQGLPTLLVTYDAPPAGRTIALQVKLASTTGFPTPVAGSSYPPGESSVASLTTTTRTVLTGLSQETAYDVRAHAYDGGMNIGAPTAPKRATTWMVPGKPTNLDADGGSGQLRVTWKEPQNKGGDGAAITACVVRWRTAAVPSTNTPAGSWNDDNGVYTDTAISHAISGLINGRRYDVEVAAQNGIDPGSGWSAVQGTPLAPRPVPTVTPTTTLTPTPVPTVTPTVTAASRPVPRATPTATPTPTPVPRVTPTVTAASTILPTATPIVTATSRLLPTATPTAIATSGLLPTARPTAIATSGLLPTARPTVIATPTPVPTARPTATAPPTPSPAPSSSPTATAKPMPTSTPTIAGTPTPVPMVIPATPPPTREWEAGLRSLWWLAILAAFIAALLILLFKRLRNRRRRI